MSSFERDADIPNNNILYSPSSLNRHKASATDVYLKGLEVARLIINPYSFHNNYVPLALELIPPLYQMSSVMMVQCTKLMGRLLDVNITRLRDYIVYFVSSFRTLLKSLSNYPKWSDDRTTALAITNNMMLLFRKLRVVFKKGLEPDVGAIVLDYIELCENLHYGKSVNEALTLLQPGVIGLLELCSKETIYAIRENAITFGKFTWDQLYDTMKATAKDKGKW